ncbi:unnamed protein product [Nippostrongylus brasiliensis]|uniref:GH26 domain-containing protein n=1 Tax=Nippostrongylus brasiliensis TaxID=27835 RepID=A0A0N4YFD0_NIPBR|nr:unnamed protein product [Nippostrongylus brasiliensis]
MKTVVLISAAFVALGHTDVLKPAPIAAAPNGYAYAVDFSAAASAKSLHCLKMSGYSTVFVRAYNPNGQGQFDLNSVSTIRLAASANLGIEVYMTPQIRSMKNGTMQFIELYVGLNKAQIRVNTVWLQVTSPIHWDPYTQNNINFLNQILTAAQMYNVRVGFYTNQYDWMQITNGAWVEGTPLWYWNVSGGGPKGETPADFRDFVPFGKWSSAVVKQFAQVENVCDMVVNRDVYVDNRMTKAVAQQSSDPNVLVLSSNFGAGPLTGLLRTD